jgi:hypothetical protein
MLVTLLVATGVEAQPRATLQLLLPPTDSLSTEPPRVAATNVLAANSVRELLHAGFPARLTYQVELWTTAGVFNRRLQTFTWDVVLRFDPVRRVYEAVRVVADRAQPLGSFALLADAISELERPQPVLAPAPRGAPGSLYYAATLTLEMLSVSDLDELGRWVRGDLNPTVRGQRNPGTAIGRGARTLLSRLLGGERSTIETRSATFRVR